jgi:hypothetical protein
LWDEEEGQQEKKGVGYEASNCFMPLDASKKKFQPQKHRPPEYLELAQSL